MLLTLILTGLAVVAVRFMGASKAAQGGVAFIGVCFVVLVQLTLPVDNPLRVATGGSLGNWLILLGVLAIVVGYSVILNKLRARAMSPPKTVKSETMTATELERYARHIVLREVGGAGQQRLRKARVLVVGAGGLGAPSLMYLAAAGVGTIGVIDDDEVSLSNLQRQVLFQEDDIHLAKVFAAKKNLNALNPHVEILPYNRRFTADIGAELATEFDLVLDGTDTFATRAVVNAACVAAKTPLVSGAISQWEGQVTLFDPGNGSPCYACLFPDEPADGLAPSCAEAGVVGALPGVVGSMMAVEAIKFITRAGATLTGEMLIYDALYGESRKIAINRRAECAVCGMA
ncbi:MAG: molybdopterin-synthase adenylyltransferase MoeB [Rhodobacteraceae bacterium]|nr:molybdopterin-synthase adenylyltransferase MoeB [Paracoccaceae bacterium]